MSDIKIQEELFIGDKELSRALFYAKQYQLLLTNSGSYGIVRTFLDYQIQGLNFRVIPGVGNQIKITNNSFAITKDGNVIHYQDRLDAGHAVPSQNQWYWVKIRYKKSSYERGTVSIDANGNLSGYGTEFTKTLRGLPNYPSRIQLTGTNDQIYEVSRVVDDTSAILSGLFVAESDLFYSMSGTFTPDVTKTGADALLYDIDDCELLFVPESLANVQPTIPTLYVDRDFYIARVKFDGTSVLVEDKRSQFWNSVEFLQHLTNGIINNAYCGVESIKYDHPFSTRDKNLVQFGWGIRSTNYTVDATNRLITLNAAVGGKVKTVTDIQNGGLNGWRVYCKDRYYLVSQTQVNGSQINLSVPFLDPASLSGEITVVPDASEIEVRFTPADSLDYTQSTVQQSFEVKDGVGVLYVGVPHVTGALYTVHTRYRSTNHYSEWQLIPSDSVGFYAESSFLDNGDLDVNNITRVPYTASNNGFIALTQGAQSFYNTIGAIDKGDLRQVVVRGLTNAQPIESLQVGVNEWVQVLDSNLTLADTKIINLLHTNAQNGSSFELIFSGNIIPGVHKLQIRDSYQNTLNPGTLLYEFTATDYSYMKLSRRRMHFRLHYSGTQWILTVLEKDVHRIGDIIMRDSLPAGAFDASGRGIAEEFQGWALCNGLNGTPDLRDRFIVSYDDRNIDPTNNIWDAAYNTIGSTGGSKNKTLQVSNLPRHDHVVFEDTHDHDIRFGTSGGSNGIINTIISNGVSGAGPTTTPIISNTHSHGGVTGKVGNDQPFDGRPPFYVLAFLKRI